MTDTAATGTDLLPGAVRAYARRMHAAIGDTHHVASPLGAWLVLALAASGARGGEAERLGEVLGMPVGEAERAARALLEHPHPAVAAAAAAWTRPATGPAAEWLAGLPDAVERGPVPSQAEADDWARRNTYGLIEEFPIDLGLGWDCVLASALATRITWLRKFDIASPEEFRSGWRDQVGAVLRTPAQGHTCTIVGHARAGDLAVHRAYGDDLVVTSVIAEPGVAATDVLDAAHEVARDQVTHTSLFDLPLGDGPSWTIVESDGDAGAEEVAAVLPAWSASSVHDLRPPAFGFGPAAAVLTRLFDANLWDAKQAAVARFHRKGFEAAAVTALAVGVSLRIPRPGRRRSALLRFDRPYAVVASVPHGPASPWIGMPVFSAWVTEPEDAE